MVLEPNLCTLNFQTKIPTKACSLSFKQLECEQMAQRVEKSNVQILWKQDRDPYLLFSQLIAYDSFQLVVALDMGSQKAIKAMDK